MNAADVVGYTLDSEVFCCDCVLDKEKCNPIFVDSEWDSFPVCNKCNEEITSIKLTDDGIEWLVFERGTNTGFMKGDISIYELWYSINDGEEIYPYDVLSEKEIKEYLTKDFEVKIIKGYGARLSAPGYLDCTDWTVFDTYDAALEYLYEEIISDYE